MAKLILREATFDDSKKLKILEEECPQGTTLKILSERDDYFFRSKLYGNHYTLVAVDGEKIIGVLAAVRKSVFIKDKKALGVFLYDLRIHPSYRRTLGGRIMLRAWKMVEKWSDKIGADFSYGYVKSDNLIMRGFFKRKSYTGAGYLIVKGRPVFRKKAAKYNPEKISCDDKSLFMNFKQEYGTKNLLPAAMENSYLTPEMKETELYDCYTITDGSSSASACIFRISEAIRTKVIKIPIYYSLAGIISRSLKKIPLPVIPETGGILKYYHCFNHTAQGPNGIELWKNLMNYFNNLVLENGNTVLTSSFDKEDKFLKEFSKGSISSIKYIIGYKKLNPEMPDNLSPFYPDPRDMD